MELYLTSFRVETEDDIKFLTVACNDLQTAYMELDLKYDNVNYITSVCLDESTTYATKCYVIETTTALDSIFTAYMDNIYNKYFTEGEITYNIFMDHYGIDN